MNLPFKGEENISDIMFMFFFFPIVNLNYFKYKGKYYKQIIALSV